MPITVPALVMPTPNARFTRTEIERRDVGPHDVRIDIAYAGICHSDIHQAREEWGASIFPMVPGHEIAGIVAEVGSAVTRHRVGDRVGIGCFVDSCRECENCLAGEEQYCSKGNVATYNGRQYSGDPTYGGYSKAIVADEHYVLSIPEGIALDEAAPLLCAGITTYSPLKHWGAGPGKQVAIVGMGGLGHMAVQIAHGLGAEVSVISQTLSKREDGKKLGADHYYASSDPDTFTRLRSTFDLIINTISADMDVDAYARMLRLNGTMVFVGVPENKQSFGAASLIGGRRSLAGSNIGSIGETQDMLNFCAEHHIGAVIETLDASDPAAVDIAYDRVVASKVRYRFVIDVATI